MAVVIGGSGLGTFDVLGQSGLKLSGTNGIRVNASTGNVVLQHQDQTLVSKGLDLSLARTYNSLGQRDDTNGDNWRFSFEREVRVVDGGVKRVTGDGHEAVFSAKGGRYESSAGAGAHDTLARQGDEWVYEEGTSGVREYYSSDTGRLLRAEDRFGNQTRYRYTGERLTAISSAGGEELRFVFNQAGQLTRVDSYTQSREGGLAHSHSKVYYGYDGQGRLASVKVDLTPRDKSISDGQVFTTTYRYVDDSSHLLKSVAKSNGSVVTLDYRTVDGKARLSRINDNGIETLLDYRTDRDNGHQLKVTDSRGHDWYYEHDERGRLVGSLSPEVNYDIDNDKQQLIHGWKPSESITRETRYHYDEQDNLVFVLDTGYRGQQEERYYYDDRANLVAKQSQNEHQVLKYHEYDDKNRPVVTHLQDGYGQGVGRRFYVYDGAVLRYEVSETGLVTEHSYDGFGQRTRSREYPGAAFAAERAPSLSAMAEWCRSQDITKTRLTDYRYQRGLLHTQTAYDRLTREGEGIQQVAVGVYSSQALSGTQRAGVWLADRPVAGQGRGVTVTVLDGQGRLVSSETFDTHDNRAESERLLNTFGNIYNLTKPGQQCIVTTRGEWRSELLQRDMWLVVQQMGISMEPWSQADFPESLLLVSERTQAIGMDHRENWSALDKQVAAPGSEGALSHVQGGTEHVRMTYDAFGNLLGTETLVGDLSTGQLQLASSTSQIVDGLGRVVSQTDAAGQTVSTRYLDSSRQVLVTQANGTTLTRTFSPAGQLVGEVRSAADEEERTTRYVYNGAGQQVAARHPDGGVSYQFYNATGQLWVTVSPLGQVTEYQRDAQGRVFHEIQYDTQLATGHWLSGESVQVSAEDVLGQIAPGGEHRKFYTEFDQRGAAISTHDEEGQRKTFMNDWRGRVIKVRSGTLESGEACIRLDEYDLSGRLKLTRDAEGYVRQYFYNIRGQLVETRHYYEPDPEPDIPSTYRITVPDSQYGRSQTLYDHRGRVRFHMDEKGALREYRYLDNGRDKAEYLHTFGVNISQLDLSEVVRDIASGGIYGKASRYQVQQLSRERLDRAGRLVSSFDRHGIETRYHYDEVTGLLRQQVSAANTADSRSVYMRYNGFGELTGRVAQAGSQAWQTVLLDELVAQRGQSQSYDTMGLKVSDYHPATGKTSYEYDKAGRLLKQTDALGQTRSIEYNVFGEVSRKRVASEVKAEYEYDRAGRVHREIDGEGAETTYLYHAGGRLSHKVRQHVSTAYGNFGGRTGSQVARHVTQYQYDRRGNVTGQQVAQDYRAGSQVSGGDSLEAVRGKGLKYASQWSRKYDHRGRLVSETDGAGVERVTEYLLGGRVRTVKLSGALQERVELDALGRTLLVANGKGEATRYEYDDTRNAVTVVSPGGIRTVTEKNAHGETVTVTDGAGHRRLFDYDHRGQVIRTAFQAAGSDTQETLSTKEYDANTGLLVFSANGEGVRTEYRYDELGRQWKVIRDADGERLQTEYRYNGQSQRIEEDREGRLTHLSYDRAGRKVRVEQGGVATTYEYDGSGRVRRMTEGAVDAASRRVLEERVTEYDRDASGRVLEKRVRSGADWQGSTSVQSVRYRYNGAGQVVEKTTGEGGVARTIYDGQGRVRYEVNALNYVTSYDYDAANRVVGTNRYQQALPALAEWSEQSVSDALVRDRRITARIYDSEGRLAFKADGLDDASGSAYESLTYATGYEYDEGGRVIRTTRYAKKVTESGWSEASPANRVSESIYDARGRLRFTINEQGQVSERGYDNEGRIAYTVRYEKAVALADRSEASLSAFKAQLASEVQAGRVRSELSVYDALGRLRFEMDGDGYLVEYQYNRHSERMRKKEFVNNGAILKALSAVSEPGASTLDKSDYGTFVKLTEYLQGMSHDSLSIMDKIKGRPDYSLSTDYHYDARGQLVAENSAEVWYVEASERDGVTDSHLERLTTIHDYDSLGNVVKTTVASGTSMANTKRFVFDVHGNQTRSIGLGGSTVIYNDHNLASVNINAEHQRRDKVYDQQGQLRFDVDELGYVTEYRYDGLGQKVAQIRYANAYTAQRPGQQAIALVDLEAFVIHGGDSRTIGWEYDERGLELSVTQSSNYDTGRIKDIVTYNAFGEKVAITKDYIPSKFRKNPHLNAKPVQFQVQAYLYSLTGQLLATKDAENYVTLHGYNGYGEQVKQQEFSQRYTGQWSLPELELWANSQLTEQRTKTFKYDNRGNQLRVTQHGVTFHEHRGDRVEEVRSDITTSSYYDYAGRVFLSVKEKGDGEQFNPSTNSQWVGYEYDALGRLVKSWSAVRSYLASWSVSEENNYLLQHTKGRQHTDYLYDAQGNQIVVRSEGRSTYQFFNAEGQLTGRKDAEGNYTRIESDRMNRVTRETLAVSAGGDLGYAYDKEVEYAYDKTGRQLSTTLKLASGDITESVQYNAFGEVIEKSNNGIVQEEYGYDGFGHVIGTVKKGVRVFYTRNWLGKVTEERPSDSLSSTYREYDNLGNLVRVRYPHVQIYDNVYEDIARKQTPTYAYQTPETIQTFDRWGNVLSRNENGAVYDFVYNDNNQVIKQTGPSVTLMYYDWLGNRIAVQDANGHWQKSYYDSSGLKLIDENGVGGRTHYFYNVHGEVVGRFNYRGQGELFTYNKNGQLLARGRLTPGNQAVVLYAKYAYDQAGQRYREERLGETGHVELTRYDEAGRVLETRGNGQHKQYQYDSFGNKTSETWLDNGRIAATKSSRYNEFGRLKSETLYDGTVVDYEYNWLGQLISKKGGSIDITYEYYDNGQLRIQYSGSKRETFSYNLQGKEAWREVTDGTRRLITKATWDSYGRLTNMKAFDVKAFDKHGLPASISQSEVSYQYDQVGNRRKVTTIHGGNKQTRWYHYDADNRMVASHTNSTDVATEEVRGTAGSRQIIYNALGQKTREVRWDSKDRNGRRQIIKTERNLGYDLNGYLDSVVEYEYDPNNQTRHNTQKLQMHNSLTGHVLFKREYRSSYFYSNTGEDKDSTDIRTHYTYADGRLVGQKELEESVVKYDIEFKYHFSGQLEEQITSNLSDNFVDVMKYEYKAREGFAKSKITATRLSARENYNAGTTHFHYDAEGNLSAVTSSKKTSNRYVMTDFNGQILIQLNGDELTAELSIGGNPIAHLSQHGIDADLLDDSASSAGEQPGTYTIQANDTLQRISQVVYGDSRYWYLIADANGLSPSEPLVVGKNLVIPNHHTQTYNGAESFKPYNESKVLGDVNPEPLPPPPPKKSCNPVAMIVMVAVAVVVTVYTAGAAAPAVAGALGGGASAGAAATVGATGMAALGGGAAVGMTTGVAVGAAAIGGAAGAAASQLVGKAMGVVDDFSWEQVALGGLAAAATAGFGAAVSNGTVNIAGGQVGQNLARSAASQATNYLGSKALGMDASFSWKGFAASAVGSVVSSEVGGYLKEDLLSDTISGFAGAAASAAIRGDSFGDNAGQMLTDAFGNALGNSAVRAQKAAAENRNSQGFTPEQQAAIDRAGPMRSSDDFAWWDDRKARENGFELRRASYEPEESYSALDSYQEGAFFDDIFAYSDTIPMEPGLGTVPIIPIEYAIDGIAKVWNDVSHTVEDYGFWSLQAGKVAGGIAAEYVFDRTVGKLIPDSWKNKASGLFESGLENLRAGNSGPISRQIGAISFEGMAPEAKANILKNFNKGLEFEKIGLQTLEKSPNRQRLYSSNSSSGQDYAVPDALDTRITELKDVEKLSITDQFRIYQESNLPIDLYISPKTQVISQPLQNLIQNSQGSIGIINPQSGLIYDYDFVTGTYNIKGRK